MGRRAGEKPIQFSLSAPASAALNIAAAHHEGDLDRDRPMKKGPMLAYVARWFLSLTRESQLDVIRAGKAMVDADADGVEIAPFGAARPSFGGASTSHVPIYGDAGSPGVKRRAVGARKK